MIRVGPRTGARAGGPQVQAALHGGGKVGGFLPGTAYKGGTSYREVLSPLSLEANKG